MLEPGRDVYGDVPLNKITKDEIENWFDCLFEKEYQNTSINGYFGTLKTMMIEAVSRKIITANPAANGEFKKLFVTDWRRVWDNDRISYTANKLAAVTGMRASEVLGLKGGFVYDGHIYLCKQFDEYGYRDTKTKDKHNVPLPSRWRRLKRKGRTTKRGNRFFSKGGAMTDIEKIIEEARAAALPFESWERLPGESAGAYFAFCAYRDYGAERNIRKAVEAAEKDKAKRSKRYGTWRNWAAAFRWRERAADYDRYTEKLKQTEKRKTIETQEELRRTVTGKMLSVVEMYVKSMLFDIRKFILVFCF
jgi:hypothetical protein